MEQLIASRALQGLGAGALEGLSFILVADLYAGRRSAALQGALAALMGVSFIAGPLIGGFLTDHVGWRWVFLVNLPIGIAALAVVAARPARVDRAPRGPRARRSTSRGIALLTAAVALVLVGLSERTHAVAGALPAGPSRRPAASSSPACSCSSRSSRFERRAAAPVIPLSLFADRRTAAILAAGATGAFGLFAGVLAAAALLPGRARRQRHPLGPADLPAAARAGRQRQRRGRVDRAPRRVPRAAARPARCCWRSARSGFATFDAVDARLAEPRCSWR